MSALKIKGAFTLVELLIGFTLLAVLSFMFVWFIVPVMRMANLGTARVDIQQTAVLACNRIATDLLRSSPSGVSLHSRAAADPAEPVVLAVIPIKDVDTEGRRVWDTNVVTFFWDRDKKWLLRRTFPPAPPGSLTIDPLPDYRPSRLAVSDLLALADSNAPYIRLATRVVNFDAAPFAGDRAFAIDLSIEEGVSGKRQAERFDYRKIVSLRN